MKKAIVMLVLASALAGCAGLRVEWVASYSTERAAADEAAKK